MVAGMGIIEAQSCNSGCHKQSEGALVLVLLEALASGECLTILK